jgi:hypothetical protein
MRHGPFDLDDVASYRQWREQKLDSAPRRIEDILVPLDDPRALRAGERDALLERCATANMAIYTSNTVGDADKEIPRRLGTQLGLHSLDSHWLTDDDAISPISVTGVEQGIHSLHRQADPLAHGWLLQPARAHRARPDPALRAKRRVRRRESVARPRDRLHPAARRESRPYPGLVAGRRHDHSAAQ